MQRKSCAHCRKTIPPNTGLKEHAHNGGEARTTTYHFCNPGCRFEWQKARSRSTVSARKSTAVPQKNTATATPPTIIAERRPKSLIGATDENVRSLEHRIYQELSLILPSSTLTDGAIRGEYRRVLDIFCAFDPEHRTEFRNKLKHPKTDGDITEIRQVMATIIAMSGLYKIEKDSQQ